jgi:hypothetical protein
MIGLANALICVVMGAHSATSSTRISSLPRSSITFIGGVVKSDIVLGVMNHALLAIDQAFEFFLKLCLSAHVESPWLFKKVRVQGLSMQIPKAENSACW